MLQLRSVKFSVVFLLLVCFWLTKNTDFQTPKVFFNTTAIQVTAVPQGQLVLGERFLKISFVHTEPNRKMCISAKISQCEQSLASFLCTITGLLGLLESLIFLLVLNQNFFLL